MATAKRPPVKSATKKGARDRAKVTPPVLTNTETFFCHSFIEFGTVKAAADRMGISELEGESMLRRPNVRKYLETYQAVFTAKMADAEVSKLMRKGITRETIAEQYMLLSMMPPERTKGSIDGQVEALSNLVDLMGLKFDTKDLPAMLRGMSADQLREYQQASGKPQ